MNTAKRSNYIFSICYAAYVLIYVARLNFTIAAPSLKSLDILTTSQIGMLGSVFSIVYACGRLLSGKISDRQSPWKMITFGLAGCGIANICIGQLPTFWAILALWGINAFSQAMLWGAILRIFAEVYPEAIAKKRVSNLSTSIATGNLLAIFLNTWLIDHHGVQYAFVVPGLLTIIISIPIVLFLRKINPTVVEQKEHVRTSLLSQRNLRNMVIPAFIHGVMKDNISLWMTVYVIDRFGIDLEQSSYYVLLIPTLGFLGRFFTPTFFRLVKEKENSLLLLAFGACACLSLLLMVLSMNAWLSVLYLSLIYMVLSAINVCLTGVFPIQYAKENQAASVSGIMDFATYLGTGLSAMLFGIMISKWGYEAMFLSWGILSTLAVVFIKMIEPKKTGSEFKNV